jgi:UDP-glucose 4-epimerase
MRYLLTGGAGFIGSHLADSLCARGHRVLILDDLSTGRVENIEALLETGLAELVQGCVTDPDLVDDCMSEVDVCVHLASAVGVRLIVDRPLDTMLRSLAGNETVLEAAARRQVRLLFTSTSEVYGRCTDDAVNEDTSLILGSPSVGRWSYALAKSTAEALAHGYARERGAESVVVRLFNTVGPRQRGAYGMVLPRLVRQALDGEPLTVFGDGTQRRCFVHVNDTVRAIRQLCEDDRALGRTLNIGNPSPISILELAWRVLDRTGSDSEVTLVPYTEAYAPGFEEIGCRRPDITAIRELTGWRPLRTLDEAIDDTVAFHRDQWAPFEQSYAA